MGVIKYFSFVLLVVMVLSVTHAQASKKKNWCSETVPYKMGMEKMTKLHFYFHDNITGDYPTTFKIAEAPGVSNTSSTFFGELLVGRAQGFFGFSARKDLSLIMGISLVFTGNKKFNGSTISIFTRNPIANTDREFPIVGGTGYFKLARGFVTGKTYWASGKNAIVEYTYDEVTFLLSDDITGDYPTTFKISEATGVSNTSSTFFGELYKVDDILTEGPDQNFRLVGRAQGFFGFSAQKDLSLIMGINLVFTGNKKFNGSTISSFTRNPIANTDRKFAIFGGTGYFKLTHGFVTAKVYWASGKNDIIEYTCCLRRKYREEIDLIH
ncbi:hypothetical protein MKX03_017073 [Papaver bracteatum]|nr:hypothetical protein MKX03_017073 [Papaver bracteatum]